MRFLSTQQLCLAARPFLLSNTRHFRFDSHVVVLPHPEKALKGGEDAAFASSRHVGVADGVGGWAMSGVDAGLYSKELVRRMEDAIRKFDAEENNGSAAAEKAADSEVATPNPVDIMKVAYLQTEAIGSSTVCLAFINPKTNTLKTANLGDSGFILYRPSSQEIVSRSQAQQFGFNCPYALGTGCPSLPDHAHQLSTPVQKGDWVVVATDGLWDNLFDDQITEVLETSRTAKEAATLLAAKALEFANDANWLSPFAVHEKEYMQSLLPNQPVGQAIGGKLDDISVVVAQIR